MSGRIRLPSLHLYVSHEFLMFLFSLSLILPPHIVWWDAKDMCASQGAPQWGRVPDKVTATKRWFLFLSLFLPFFFSVHISLLSFSCYLSFFVLYNCPIFLFFSFPSHLLEPRPLFLFLSFSIFPTWQPSWGMCSVIERTIQNNNKLSSPLPLTFHLPPSSPFCNLHGLGPIRRVANGEHIARGNEGFPLRGLRVVHKLTIPSVSPFRDFPSFPLCLFDLICSAISCDVSIRTHVRLASKSIEKEYNSVIL